MEIRSSVSARAQVEHAGLQVEHVPPPENGPDVAPCAPHECVRVTARVWVGGGMSDRLVLRPQRPAGRRRKTAREPADGSEMSTVARFSFDHPAVTCPATPSRVPLMNACRWPPGCGRAGACPNALCGGGGQRAGPGGAKHRSFGLDFWVPRQGRYAPAAAVRQGSHRPNRCSEEACTVVVVVGKYNSAAAVKHRLLRTSPPTAMEMPTATPKPARNHAFEPELSTPLSTHLRATRAVLAAQQRRWTPRRTSPAGHTPRIRSGSALVPTTARPLSHHHPLSPPPVIVILIGRTCVHNFQDQPDANYQIDLARRCNR